MATLEADPAGGGPESVNLSSAQTGNGASTNVLDRGRATGPALLKITTTVGATPTVTILIEGSADGTNFFPAAYADSATPATLVGTTFVITTATTVYKLLPDGQPWRYLRLTYSANTNVTSTADVTAFS